MTTTTSMTTIIEGDMASISINHRGNAILESTTTDNMGKERRISMTMDRAKAQSLIEVLTDYLDVAV